eukprot:9499858-Pyramimonas_sp.AAC.1
MAYSTAGFFDTTRGLFARLPSRSIWHRPGPDRSDATPHSRSTRRTTSNPGTMAVFAVFMLSAA